MPGKRAAVRAGGKRLLWVCWLLGGGLFSWASLATCEGILCLFVSHAPGA